MSIFNDEQMNENMKLSVESSMMGVVKVYGRAHVGSAESIPAAEAFILNRYVEMACGELLVRSESEPEFDSFRALLVDYMIAFIKRITPMNDLERLMAEFNTPE